MTKWQFRLLAVACWLGAIALAIPFLALHEEYAAYRDGRAVTAKVVRVAPYSKKHVEVELQYDGDKTKRMWPTIDEAPAFTVGTAVELVDSGQGVIRADQVAGKKPSLLFVAGAFAALVLGAFVWWLPRRDAKRRAARRDPLDVVIDAARRTRNVRIAAAVIFTVFVPLFAILPSLDSDSTRGMAIAIYVIAALTAVTAVGAAVLAYRLRDPRRNWVVDLIEHRPEELAWFYVHEYRGQYGARAQEVAICTTAGKRVQLRLVPEDVEPLLAELARRAPHATRGYDPKLDRAYKKDPASLRRAA